VPDGDKAIASATTRTTKRMYTSGNWEVNLSWASSGRNWEERGHPCTGVDTVLGLRRPSLVSSVTS
jgi:hypothetical protein